MFKMFAFLFLFLPSVFGANPVTEPQPCTCPEISNLQKTGETSNSLSYAWSSGYMGAQYKVWYHRAEDGYTSGFFYTYNLSYNFTGLSAGHYTFYFQSLCGNETSSYIGIEDTVGI
jgi:hypothetical protein